eukprot:1843701-Prymnesium_polylepis.1
MAGRRTTHASVVSPPHLRRAAPRVMPFSPPGGGTPAPPPAKAPKAASSSSPVQGITAFVDGTDSTARLQHTFVAGESLSLITKTIRECQESRAGVELHEKTMWDTATRSRVENPRFVAKYAGFCNTDEDGDFVTDAVEFVEFVHTNVLAPLATHFESVTYFLKRKAGKVPSKYTSYE